MTVDQLTLSIYKMFFYQGTERLTETGDVKISPGVGKQVLDPKNIQWLQVPGPGAEAWQGIEMFKKDLDDASGITEPLMGTITGKTAFEIAQAKEAALKRLKMPLDNVEDALEQEAYITLSLINILYSIPETYKIADPQLIEDYLGEVKGDSELYEDLGTDEEGNRTIEAKVYPEFPLNLEEDEKGNLIESSDTRFFRIKPRFLKWEGIVNVKGESTLTPSKQLDKALEMEMYNMLIPLLGNPPEIYNKVAKNIVKLYDKDPREILPDSWMQEAEQGGSQEPLIVPAGQMGQEGQQIQPGQTQELEAERLLPRQGIPERPKNIAQRLVSRLTRPLRKV